ncbi:MAG: LCP family protein, partial [Candidatus Saccharibacteria bacterium]
MRNNKPSIDGFIPRRTGVNIGDYSKSAKPLEELDENRDLGQQSFDPSAIRRPVGVARSEIDESLREIDDSDDDTKKQRRRKRAGKNKKPAGSRKKLIKRIVIALFIIILGIVGYVGVKTLLASGNIFKGNVFDIFQNEPLKMDANGRSNILILGTSEDDPGHGGAYLTDSMMILSVDQNKKNAYMFSIPRDLYVQYQMGCNSGYQGKINEYFNCVNDDYTKDSAEDERMTKTRSFIGSIFGLDVQYGVHVNNTVIKDAVNAVGGVDVDIEGSGGAPGILDRNFDWRCGYSCYLVKYDNGIHHLDGDHALYLAMARGDIAPTYGLGNSNFDREKNQQKIIIALKNKAASTGTLTDLGKVTGLIDALGKNLRTNIQTKEIRTLMGLGNDIKS